MRAWLLFVAFLLAGFQSSAVCGEVLIETQKDAAYRIGKGLRCPVCQGMPIAESPSPMAQDMMKRVREMVAGGQDEAQIDAFFVQRYGEWVLLRPVVRGFSLAVWLTPPALLGLGLWAVRRQVKRPPLAPAAFEPPDALPVDPYVAAIREEVNR